MVGQGLMAGWRRAAGLLALVAMAVLVLLAQPPHAEARATDAPTAAAHHTDDQDAGAQVADLHCAAHCASHAAAAPERGSALAAATFGGAHRYGAQPQSALEALARAPPIRPPAA